MSKTFIGKRAPQFKTQAVVDGDVLQRESTWSDVSTCFEMLRSSKLALLAKLPSDFSLNYLCMMFRTCEFDTCRSHLKNQEVLAAIHMSHRTLIVALRFIRYQTQFSSVDTS
uniref:Uncharacterized protein n=1 Tax=Caenorhabditis japonica TaxID=281687 RepID=A0A8R1IC14_CAEJA